MATKKKTSTETDNWFDALAKAATDNLDGMQGALNAFDGVETNVLDLMKETLDYQVSLARQIRQLSVEATRTSLAWMG